VTPARLLRLVAVLVVAGLALTAAVLDRDHHRDTAAGPVPAVVGSAGADGPAAVPDATPATPTAARPATPAPGSDIAATAVDAVTAWQDSDVEERTAALAALATADYQAAAGTIDPTRVPSAPVAAARLRVEADGQALVDVELADDTRLAATLVQDGDRWLLADLQPVDPVDGGTG